MNPSPSSDAYLKAEAAKRRSPELEPIILQSAYETYLYSLNIIKGKWEEAEPIIAKSVLWSYQYAKDVLKWKIKGNKDFYIARIPTLWDLAVK